jgi:hypothetical protein
MIKIKIKYSTIKSQSKTRIKIGIIRKRRYKEIKHPSTAVLGVASQQAAIITTLFILHTANSCSLTA